ncbi:3-oxoacyl-[acyl-carrier protein] reductase [Amycolatopsis thermoflava]|uniref:3-oxoacyl-[acyl-carrier protein] reductase n=1 Tax=Amycolatopsis thermoflava TaxID=84480 RepID=A0A3N2GSM7_9PSEU|nr:glucose 1-dehydrogenase [Amycolatopsis thermoflava]ROS39330.1 3-oxoacyl-[acyl-carrier protein] reductase [Amycolatopsis thermoflava]
MLTDRVALVTGGSRGIGRGIAERLGAEGARVVVNYRTDADAAAKVVATIDNAGGQAVAVQADVADPAQVVALFDAVESAFGGLDILVGNAGIARFAPLAEAGDEDFERVFATNTRSTFVALREAAKRLRDGGRIIVISSGATVTARPNGGVYAASKAAAEQLVRAAAKELGPRGITANSVLPGATRSDALEAGMDAERLAATTAQTPLGRLGEPSDIASIVAFLASADGGWITGQTIHAGGGLF